MVENRTNIAWYLPRAYAAKLLPVFKEIDEWYYKQAQSEANTDAADSHDPTRPARTDDRAAGADRVGAAAVPAGIHGNDG